MTQVDRREFLLTAGPVRPPIRSPPTSKTFMTRKTRALGDAPVYFISLKPSKLRFDQIERQSQVNNRIWTLGRERGDIRFIDIVPRMAVSTLPH